MNNRESVLIIDDEPEYLGWLVEYLGSKNFKVDHALNISDALKISTDKRYRLILVDMNIPAPGAASELLDDPISKKYPGFKLAHTFRNQGYHSHQIIAYTVHDDDLLGVELDRIRCRYVLKGRPNILKSVIENSIKGKPTDDKDS